MNFLFGFLTAIALKDVKFSPEVPTTSPFGVAAVLPETFPVPFVDVVPCGACAVT